LWSWKNDEVSGGFKYFFIFTPKFREDSHFDYYFSDGLKPHPFAKMVIHLDFGFLKWMDISETLQIRY